MVFRMALSPKIPALQIVPRVTDDVSVQTIALVPKPPLKLDFAANPNHYRVDGYGGRLKPKPVRTSPQRNLARRPVLSLALLCDNMQVPNDND
jgi:hypothetical protein